MEISVRRAGPAEEVAILSIRGVIDSETVDSFAAAVNELLDEECYNIVLDLAEMNYINTAGLSIIADTFKRTQQNRGALKILNATDTIRELLDVVRFTRIIDIYEDEEEALKSFDL